MPTYTDDLTMVGLRAFASGHDGVPHGLFLPSLTAEGVAEQPAFALHLTLDCPEATRAAAVEPSPAADAQCLVVCGYCPVPDVLCSFAVTAATAVGAALVARSALAAGLDGDSREVPLAELGDVDPGDRDRLVRGWHLMHARRILEDRMHTLTDLADRMDADLVDMDFGAGGVRPAVRNAADELCAWVRFHAGLSAELDRQVDALAAAARSDRRQGRRLGLAMLDVMRDSPLPALQAGWCRDDWSVLPLVLPRVADDGVFALVDVPSWVAPYGLLDEQVPCPAGFDATAARVVLDLVVDLDLTLSEALAAALAATTH